MKRFLAFFLASGCLAFAPQAPKLAPSFHLNVATAGHDVGKSPSPLYNSMIKKGSKSQLADVVIDPDYTSPATRPDLFGLLGLTQAEARVASLLGCGDSPQAVAEALGLSTGTVRNHMKSIYAKLDLTRQSELVALAGRLAGMGQRQ